MIGPLRHASDVRPEYLALGFLEDESLHGYDLYRRFEADLGRVWHISQSQMYSILKRLEAQGHVRGSRETGDRNQAKRGLSLTEAGRGRFEAWLKEPSDCSSRIIRLEFISRLYFARRSHPELLAEMVEEQKATIARQLENHRAICAAIPEAESFNRLSLELRIRQLAGIQFWIEENVASEMIDKDQGLH
jgi:PadR family transcriptional regulator AphA